VYLECGVAGDARQEAKLQDQGARASKRGHSRFALGDAVSQIDLQNATHGPMADQHTPPASAVERLGGAG
jgi:hypothetical protein